ncbi:MAG: hypothetical protein IBX70_02700 [Clostridia bacterium]|nr:hypothetical protein [Clostridia bacterium]
MSKKLCKLVKDDILEDDFKTYVKYVRKPHYVCKKCGRASADEDMLCKPQKIKEKDKE